MLPKAFKSCPKSKKSPDLVTLIGDPNKRHTRVGVVIIKKYEKIVFPQAALERGRSLVLNHYPWSAAAAGETFHQKFN